MARVSKKAKRLALARKKRCFFTVSSVKIGVGFPGNKLVKENWETYAISSSLSMSRICFSSGALHTFLFLHESLSAIFHFANANKTHFPATATRVSRPCRSGI